MYFPFFELKKWGKKTAEARRHNCAALPYQKKRKTSLIEQKTFRAMNIF